MSDLAARIARRTAVSWTVGVLALAALSVGVSHRGSREVVDGQVIAHALAVYGLAWFDEDGFHDEELLREPELLQGPVRLSVVGPDGLAFGDQDAPRMVERAMEWEEPIWDDRDGLRWVAIPTYDENDAPIGAVIASMPLSGARAATGRFAALTGLGALLLVAAGLVVSRRTAAEILTRQEEQMREREQTLAGAAHELRTPLATLGAVLETTPLQDAAAALPDLRDTVAHASEMVDRVLTWSRLGYEQPALEPVRLDLLVELLVDEDLPYDAAETVVMGDPRLLQVAARNLLENARVHGGGVVRVVVRDGRLEVHDHGDGVPEGHRPAPFTKGPDSPGTGLGLALVERIAALHHGHLELRPVVTLVLPAAG
jgi:signal transduction histidine kinase